ncbi:MAG: CinA family protein [Candidatus Omnitrophica bacterium]|nr:CinA family protein [Candidatus Omnitrophota bacterium]
MLLEKIIARVLKRTKKTLCTAESCTGGLISHRLTNIPGSSKFFIGAIIAYSNEIKASLLKIPRKTIENYGAVSKQTAILMSKRARKIFKSDFALSVTGIAGPSGGSKEKPVGLAFISFSSALKTICEKHIFKGSRLEIKKQAADAALNLLIKNINTHA